ncbi:MAG: DUF4192 family protein [Actinobacteria bacterium]|uniref:Unannotated protein n=1 Tax=freshwater metagenome TaxID=449393 RepID=A0A6J6PM21_9ZZZZ|nr:DUF4192 family protein [Actinomycetota bacterium]
MTDDLSAPPTLTAHCPDDLLAMVPLVIGFTPEDSVVMLTFAARRAFHARVDLPPPERPDLLDDLSDALLEPAERHGVRLVAFVVHTEDADLARRAAAVLVAAFTGSGIEVIDALHADGLRWRPAVGQRAGLPADGVPYDVSEHRFAAQAVVAGRVVHGTRAELARSVAADPERVAAVSLALEEPPVGPVARGDWRAVAVWVRGTIAHHIEHRTVPSDAEAASILLAITTVRVRDAAWHLMLDAPVDQHVELWTDLVRRAPAALLAAPASLLGVAAWLAGHGALAWCAVDRCREHHPDYSLARLVEDALQQAMPPETMSGGWHWEDGLDASA